MGLRTQIEKVALQYWPTTAPTRQCGAGVGSRCTIPSRQFVRRPCRRSLDRCTARANLPPLVRPVAVLQRPAVDCGQLLGLLLRHRHPPGLALGEDLRSTPVQGAKRVVAEAKARERPRMVSRWADSHEAGGSLRRSPYVAVSVTPWLGGCAAEGGGVRRVRITPSALPALEILGQGHRSAVQ